jgi:hypothetical protein
MGLVIQCHYRLERLREIQHPRRDLFCSRYHKYVTGVYAIWRDNFGAEEVRLFAIDAGAEPTGSDIQERPGRDHES